ncbi:bifunctional diguanylate cyclase/phosphodiesterase [Ruminococcus sp.]|uniref:bifunctional diguanylate cyclase/phosphodiesterase n=1 Tax=Ruminococcus sp. TaxID=41978 RepID=UPI0025CCEDA4|nr:bifunctional diguanylate cyclase/phosphodiesterase [Ruminococcus sp.]
MDFHIALERFLEKLNSMNKIDFSKVRAELGEICGMFRITKIATKTYQNVKCEELGKGDILISYDNGEKGRVGLSERIVTDLMSVIVCEVYIREDAEPWNKEEERNVSFFLNTVSVYVSRSRIQDAACRFAFFDDDGYHNFRYLIRYIQKSAQEGTIAGKAAIHFNLKHFALVNQQIGRNLGSMVMHSFFNSIAEMINGKGEICRVGGDNFALVCERECLNNVLGYLSGAAVVYDVRSGDRIMVSASVGVFLIPDDFVMDDIGDILDKIISASSAAKVSDKQNIVFFSDEMVAEKDKVMRIQHLFPEAVLNEEYHVFYQPKVNINTGEIVGAEALCRWFREGKIIPPLEFIPILEHGLEICKLDFYMLDHVCKDIKRWLNEGRNVVRISVNLSRKHMVDMDLLEHILEIVDSNNVPHEYIEIELTETTTDVEFRDLKRVVSGLQNAGICTSVDDFGMGYSSLNLIKEIPWDVMKVDKNFIPEHEDGEESARDIMFHYVVGMARAMGLECIAEGVETQAQVKALRRNKCDLAQGFLFDKPLPVEEFEERLRKGRYDVE